MEQPILIDQHERGRGRVCAGKRERHAAGDGERAETAGTGPVEGDRMGRPAGRAVSTADVLGDGVAVRHGDGVAIDRRNAARP